MSSIPGVNIGHNFTVRIGVGADPVEFTQVDGWQDITFPDQQRGEVEITHNKSPDETEEFILALKASTDWQAQVLYVQGDPRDILLDSIYQSREAIIFEITPRKSLEENAANGVPVQWAALVKGYAPSLPVKGAMMATVTLKVMGRILPIVTGAPSGSGD